VGLVVTEVYDKTTKQEHTDFIDKRRNDTGLEICESCGGVIWHIDGQKVCGDCRSITNQQKKGKREK